MTKLEKLLADLCPDGVERVPLGEIAVRTKGTPITAAQMKELDKPNAPIKIFAGGKTVAFFDYADLPEKDINTFPSVVVKSRGVIEFEYYDKPFSHKNEMWSYHSEREDVDIKYIYYFLKTQEAKLREKATSMGAFPQIAIPDTEKLQIPLPPLPVQREIVRILDNFTELTARKKQYDYYRDKLLSFNELEKQGGVRWVTLGEVAEYSKMRIDASKLNSQNYVGVDNLLPDKRGKMKSNYVPENGAFTRFDEEDILIGNIRPYLKKIWRSNLTGGTNGDVLVVHLTNKSIRSDFLYHLLASDNFFAYDMQHSKGAKMPRGSKEAVMRYTVPLSSLEEQARIVEILDKFDALTTDITNGLPAEIEARKKQYEYYREKLLTFA